MDITQGEFKDFYAYPNGRSSRNSHSRSKLSSQGSVCSSLELLPNEQKQDLKNLSDDLNNNEGILEYDDNGGIASPLSSINAVNHFSSYELKSRSSLSSSLSDNSAVSSSSDTESVDTVTDTDKIQIQQSEEEIEIEKAIKKMRKLDRILMGKMKHEREVKRQRLMAQKSFYADLEKLNAENKESAYPDVSTNTSKYLALLPPSQQLDVLLEQHQAVDDFQPIFQTQLYSNHSLPTHDQAYEKTESERSYPSSTTKSDETRSESKREKKTRSVNSKGKSQDDNKTDFIERNIQLAKDAGSMVAMTEEEKKRLDVLLEDVDEDEAILDIEDEAGTLAQLAPTRYGEGFTPEQKEAEHLQEIDGRLRSLLSPTVFTSISSTTLMSRTIPNTSSEMQAIGRKVAKCSVSEILPPEQRLDEIEEKLSKLNEKWKERFDDSRPRLSDEQLHRLLEECSRSTSPNSITTSNFSKLEFRSESDRYSPVSCDSHQSEIQSSVDLHPPDSRCSSRSSTVTLTSDQEFLFSKPPVLDKHVLDSLLREAKLSLGIADTTEDDDASVSSFDSNESLIEEGV